MVDQEPRINLRGYLTFFSLCSLYFLLRLLIAPPEAWIYTENADSYSFTLSSGFSHILYMATPQGDNVMKTIKIIFTLVLTLLAGVTVSAGESDPLFQSNEILDITLTGPFGRIDRERDKDVEYEDGTLSYMDENGDPVVLDMKLEVRGNNRLRPEVCRFSQLCVNLRRGQVEGTLFENQNRIKLVAQCRGQSRYADYIIKEQQAYQIFNQLSEISFDTRLLRVTYLDSENDRNTRTHLAFFIEHQNRLSRLNEMENYEENRIPIDELDPQQSSLVTMFEYMISNVDYSIIQSPEDDECCHNSKLLISDSGEHLPVPYDFDSSGFVDTRYAVPAAGLGQRNIHDRIYRGFCVPDDVMDATVAKFLQARDAIDGIVSDTTFVSNRVANRSLNYVDDFYQIIEDPEELQSEIIEECRG